MQQPQSGDDSAVLKPSKNPLRRILRYMQGQADLAAQKKWEGSSYLSPAGKEPQQRSGSSDHSRGERPTSQR